MSRSLFLSLSLAASCWGAHAAGLQYTVTELPAAALSADEPNYVSGYALDGKGRTLIGVSINSGPFHNGELCHKGRCVRVKPKHRSATWMDFNGSDVLVGAVYEGFQPQAARRNGDGTVQLLGDGSGYAWGVNSSGVAVGADGTGAFYFDTSKHVLPTLGGWNGAAFAITDDGLIVGESMLENGQTRAVLFQPDGGITNLGVLEGGTRSSAYAINAKGVAVGASNNASQQDVVPVKFEAGAVIELGTLGGTWGAAESINKAGTVVGLTTINPQLDTHAFVHHGTKMVDLNDAISADAQGQWLLYSAVDINDAGQILVNAYRRSPWGSVALLLTPQP